MSKEKKKDDKKDNKKVKDDNVKGETVGIKAVLEHSLQSYDKLPMLEIIFDKFVRQLSTSLRNLTSEAVDISIDEFTSQRFGSYIESLKKNRSIIVFRAIEWENLGLIVFNNSMIFSFVDFLLGGKKNTTLKSELNEDKELTLIESGLARQISEAILNELSLSFDQASPVTFSFERLESNPNFVTISRAGDAVILLKLKLEVEKMVEVFDLIIPYKTIEPIKEQMQQVFLGDQYGNDQEWEKSLNEAILEINMPLEAVITEKISTIEEIFKLQIGDTFVLDHAKNQDVVVKMGPKPLFAGSIGKIDDKVAIDFKRLIEE